MVFIIKIEKSNNYIFYYHVLNDRILEIIDYLIDANSVVELESLILDKYSHVRCSIVVDDAHISNKKLADNWHKYQLIYYGIIGQHSNVHRISTDLKFDNLPDIKVNLQSAAYHSISGNKNGFINYKNILDKAMCINHTFSHMKYFTNMGKIIGTFDVKNPYNWHVAMYHLNETPSDFNIYESGIVNLRSFYDSIVELKMNMDKSMNDVFVIAPWNKINDGFIMAAKKLGYRYILDDNVYSIYDKTHLNIPRINLEKLNFKDIKKMMDGD